MSKGNVYKVVLVGNAGVGKTQMLGYYTRDPEKDYEAAATRPTIGVEFGSKKITAPDGSEINAQIWDTAGQERYRAITSAHYRRAAGALVVYDCSVYKTFEDAKGQWLEELKDSADEDSVIADCIMFVGNKTDLMDAAEDKSDFVSEEEHNAFCEKEGLMGMRTSAITGSNLDDAFNQLLIQTWKMTQKKRASAPLSGGAGDTRNRGGGIKIQGGKNKPSKKGCC